MKIVSFKLKFENVVIGECFKLNGMEYRKIEPVGLYNCVSEDMTMALMKPGFLTLREEQYSIVLIGKVLDGRVMEIVKGEIRPKFTVEEL